MVGRWWEGVGDWDGWWRGDRKVVGSSAVRYTENRTELRFYPRTEKRTEFMIKHRAFSVFQFIDYFKGIDKF